METFAQNPAYLEAPELKQWKLESSYIPAPYRYPFIDSKGIGNKKYDGVANAKALCAALGVDAVATLEMEFVKIHTTKALVLEAIRMGVRGRLVVRDKNGKLVFNKSISKISDTKGIVLVASVFTYTTDTEVMYNEVKADFLATVDSALDNALK